MAGNWHKSVSSKDHLDLDSVGSQIPREDFSSSLIQVKEKNFKEKFKDKIKSMDLKSSFVLGLKYSLFMVPLVATYFLLNNIDQKQSLGTNAAIGNAKFLFQNSNIVLPPETEMQVLVNTDVPVGFVHSEINFDRTRVKLVSEIDVSGSQLKRVVKVTSMSEANSTGKIEIVLALDPASINTPPSGGLQLGKFRIATNTQNTNLSSNLTFNISNSQVVNVDQSLLSLTSNNTTLTINPVATATPVATQAATASPASIVVPSASPDVPTVSCGRCHRNRCDNVCDTRRDNLNYCLDCL